MKLRTVLERIDERVIEYEKRPLFTFLRDPAVDPRRKLVFAPHVAHFVLTFADLCRHILPQDPPSDEWQPMVNTHSREDADHWKWYLIDLATLECDGAVPYADAIRAIWSDKNVRTRKLSYGLCHFAFGADSITKLVLVQCVEAVFKPTMRDIETVAREFESDTGKLLYYLGSGHAEVEDNHDIECPEARASIEEIEIEPDRYAVLVAMIDETVELFAAFADEMLELAKAP